METNSPDEIKESAKKSEADEKSRPWRISPDEEIEEEDLDWEGTKWLAAMAYLPLVCLIPLFMNREDPYLQRHAKQGFILFMTELLALLLMYNVIWYLIIAFCLAVSLLGTMGIILKGEIRIPYLSNLAEKIKI
jgi:uncharacterized membrane protein